MSRLDRLREYSRPTRRENWDGESCDKANLDRWSQRATENSKVAPRARGGAMRLPDTDSDGRGGKITAGAESGVGRLQKAAHADKDARAAAKADTNHASSESDYLASIRRQA
ncbi:hypothetical protein NLM31_21050 [Bradyrhizobium sp. CCGUVB4N]|uniref:hypothetical protein n=1 Tax=Bradyrhizobium sp. CCGUVB4N TaxID=2949631 RepID=UPI0020B40931|nr:hypothetical protein [Bradyrhizobium sp. CCGUVB4N]MCP3382858.1 hypothetical protein [Bradyrhizobium sp. CCGUVB4N]